MKTQRMNVKLIAAAAATFGAIAWGVQPAQAQWGRDRRDFPIGRDYRVSVQRLVERLEHDSNEFRNVFERGKWDDRSRWDRDRRDDRRRDDRYYDNRYDSRYHEDLKRQIQRFDEHVEDLKRHLNRSDYWTDTRSQVADLVRMARSIDRDIDDRRRYGSLLSERWGRVVSDLNALSMLFGAGRV